ncbi:glycoside hydrolase family protein [Zobellia galactanivorans]|uniref:glycoside hydrolase family protein n=1 Tax=Zobellia galactanivorans (strain DSM 12802 / CCUG 47099 / CIP 106680 / NCIMB 13871 / Dsij) TaxID=63186 RepID=UPI001C06C512|nr:glycoside hydrolase family protein [Zobellia galactanivorans]MBU3026153.1 glycoside hydrolase family protein [Zobellia galactanivorans]
MKLSHLLLAFAILNISSIEAQQSTPSKKQKKKAHEMVVKRERPAAWDKLVWGGRFMDRFLPMPDLGGRTSDTWGSPNVIPRDINNGVESPLWSYWGGNTLLEKEDGKYHLFVCRWPESAEKGHMAYPNSRVVHGVSESPFGPFKIAGEVGHGHNPTWYVTKKGRYVLYVTDKYYVAQHINGPWREGQFEFDKRDRKTSSASNFMHNCTFAQREDGSFLMINRHGYPWFSKDGLATWNMVGEKSVYPPVEGKYEDPVVWKDHVQYHLIVNDWLGRIAWYLRSKDGVNWKVDPGEAYMPGISVHKDGTKEGWHKYERIRILQDEKGRAIAANFAVIDTLKYEDLPNDNHSSKLIVVPLRKEKLLTVLNTKKITSNTKDIKLKIEAENDFDPHSDIDLASLRFGASEEVNFGKGSKLSRTEKWGDDLILIFEGKGNGLTDENFAGKLLGKDKNGELLFGYARLPEVEYITPILSSRAPVFTKTTSGYDLSVKVENFGQVASSSAHIAITLVENGKETELASGALDSIKPFQSTTVSLTTKVHLQKGTTYTLKNTISSNGRTVETFTQTLTLQE